MQKHSIESNNKPWHGLSISNLLTYLSLISGIIGYLFFIRTNNLKYIGLFLCFSFIFDIYDGAFARSFKKRSAFVSEIGGYLDSLTDFAVFGILPVLAIIQNQLSILKEIQVQDKHLNLDVLILVSGIIFIICSMTRLAAFHILTNDKSYFVGLPTTLSGLILSLTLLITPPSYVISFSFVLLILSYFMVSSYLLPRPSKKGLIVLTILTLSLASIYLYKL